MIKIWSKFGPNFIKISSKIHSVPLSVPGPSKARLLSSGGPFGSPLAAPEPSKAQLLSSGDRFGSSGARFGSPLALAPVFSHVFSNFRPFSCDILDFRLHLKAYTGYGRMQRHLACCNRRFKDSSSMSCTKVRI